MSTEIIIPNF